MKTTRVNDVELCYRDEGEGQSLVFLHAFPLDQTMWDDQVSHFSASYRVITLDWRGFGKSSLGEGPSTMAAFASDLAGLLDFLKIDKTMICGLSMGGYAAMSFLQQHADRVRALVLADTRATADTDEGRQNRLKMAAQAREEGPGAIAEQMISRLFGSTSLNTRANVVERVRAMILANRREGIARALLGMAERPDSTSVLSGITSPVLVVVGEEDTLTPPAEAEAMCKVIPGSEMATLKGVGHLANLEDPQTFNTVVSRFISLAE